MIRIAFLALLLAGCATTRHDQARDARATSEQAEEAVERMKVEFDALTGGAS